jgi:hypothetical protein
MKYPDRVPIYAHLLCQEELSEIAEDTAQHLFQRAVEAGLVQPDADYEGSGPCSEPMMMRLLEVSASAVDVELRRLVNRLEALLMEEFPTETMRQ